MSNYNAIVKWRRKIDEAFIDNKYSRAHLWEFDGGEIIQASSSPQVVPLPYSESANIDPEEAFIASISSCHMLFFLSIAAKKRLVIENYIDEVSGIMQLDTDKKMAMTDVFLKPEIKFSGLKKPTPQQIKKIHQQAHEHCFIANSIKTTITIL